MAAMGPLLGDAAGTALPCVDSNCHCSALVGEEEVITLHLFKFFSVPYHLTICFLILFHLLKF